MLDSATVSICRGEFATSNGPSADGSSRRYVKLYHHHAWFGFKAKRLRPCGTGGATGTGHGAAQEIIWVEEPRGGQRGGESSCRLPGYRKASTAWFRRPADPALLQRQRGRFQPFISPSPRIANKKPVPGIQPDVQAMNSRQARPLRKSQYGERAKLKVRRVEGEGQHARLGFEDDSRGEFGDFCQHRGPGRAALGSKYQSHRCADLLPALKSFKSFLAVDFHAAILPHGHSPHIRTNSCGKPAPALSQTRRSYRRRTPGP